MNKKLKYLGWYQFLSGILGIITTLFGIVISGTMSNLTVLIFFLAICMYAYSIFCGKLLIKNLPEEGIRFSIINQFLQVFYLSIGGVIYQFSPGLHLGLGINFSDGGLIFKLNMFFSSFKLSKLSKVETFSCE